MIWITSQSTLQQNLTQFVTSAVTSIGVIVMMLSISWQLTLVALLMIPLSFDHRYGRCAKITSVFRGSAKSLGLLNNQVEETYGGHTIVKTFNHTEKIRKYLKKKIRICMPLVGKLNLFRQSSCR